MSVEVLNRYAINVSANPENGGTAVAEGSFIHGTEVTVTAVPNESDGYRFVNWTEGDTACKTPSSIHTALPPLLIVNPWPISP